MSDNESNYYSDSESESENSELDIEEIDANKIKTPTAVIPKNIETFDDSEIEDSDSENENEESESDADEEIQTGGVEDLDYSSEEENEEKDIDEDEEVEQTNKTNKQTKNKKNPDIIMEDDDDEDEDYDDNYLQKFDIEINKNYINEFHPECLIHNYDEIAKLSKIVKNEDNIIIDPLHRTIPFLTKYEKARVLGQRAKQIETGAKPLVKVPENIIDGYIIAELELKEKKLPFIIKRPLPNGSCEYWNIRDLEIVGF